MAIASLTFEQKMLITGTHLGPDSFSLFDTIDKVEFRLFEVFLGVNLVTNIILTGLIGRYYIQTMKKLLSIFHLFSWQALVYIPHYSETFGIYFIQ
jgi:hypothetical protein